MKKIKIKRNYENLISLYITEEKLNEGFFKLFFLVLLEVSYSKINIITMKLLFFLFLFEKREGKKTLKKY